MQTKEQNGRGLGTRLNSVYCYMFLHNFRYCCCLGHFYGHKASNRISLSYPSLLPPSPFCSFFCSSHPSVTLTHTALSATLSSPSPPTLASLAGYLTVTPSTPSYETTGRRRRSCSTLSTDSCSRYGLHTTWLYCIFPLLSSSLLLLPSPSFFLHCFLPSLSSSPAFPLYFLPLFPSRSLSSLPTPF